MAGVTTKVLGGGRRDFAPWADPAAKPLVRFEGIAKRFGSTVAVDHVSLSHLRARVLRAARSVGLRQDHAVAHARRVRDAERRPHPARRHRHRGGPALSAAGQHDVPELCAVPASHGRRQHRVRAQAGSPAAAGDRGARRRDAGAGAPDGSRRDASRISCRAASASAWRSRARSPSGRRCCCSTSRWRRSTSKLRDETQLRADAAAGAARHSPSSSSPTIRRRR